MYFARLRRLVLLALFGLAPPYSTFAADLHSLWTVQGKYNTVYLFGSMHLLRANEPMPAVAEDAYRDAESLVMEIDMDDVDPLAGQKITVQLGLLPNGETLPDQLDRATAAKLAAYTQRLGVPPTMFNQFQPWLAAITLSQLHLQKLGLDSQSGIEQRMMAKAIADGKEIMGLETVEEQLRLLAEMSPNQQASFLKQTLAEEDQVEQEIEQMIAAWRTGDTGALEKLLGGIEESPELYRKLIVDRNRRWLTRLESLLGDRQDYLVIVGAMHLVGADSVIKLLERQRYKVIQH